MQQLALLDLLMLTSQHSASVGLTAVSCCAAPQFLMVKELFMLARVAQQDRKLPGFRAQQWYFFFVATFYLYLR